jgi:hypothetical protein
MISVDGITIINWEKEGIKPTKRNLEAFRVILEFESATH